MLLLIELPTVLV